MKPNYSMAFSPVQGFVRSELYINKINTVFVGGGVSQTTSISFKVLFHSYFLGNISFFRSRSILLIYVFSSTECNNLKDAQLKL